MAVPDAQRLVSAFLVAGWTKQAHLSAMSEIDDESREIPFEDQMSFFKGDEIVTPGSSMGEYAGFKLNETAFLNDLSSTKFYQVAG